MELRPWTEADTAEMHRLEGSGLTVPQIARQMGRTKAQVQGRRWRGGIAKRAKPDRAVTAEKKARARRLLLKSPHLTNTEVAAKIGLNTATVRGVRAAAKVPRLNHRAAAARREDLIRQRARETGRISDASRKYLSALASGPLGTGAVARACGVRKVAAWAALDRLRSAGRAFAEGKAEGRKSGRTGHTWYSLDWWLLHNTGLIYAVAHKAQRKNPHCEIEDLASVIRLAVAKSVPTFRADGHRFSTYALTAARYAAVDYGLAERRRGVHVAANLRFDVNIGPAVGSLDALVGESGEPYPLLAPCDPEPVGSESAPRFWTDAVAGLPERVAAAVLGYYRDGRNLTDIGAELGGVSRERARQLVEKGVRLIRESRALAEYEQ